MFRVVLVALLFAAGVVGCGGGGSGSEPPPDLSGTIEIEAQTRIDVDTADDIRLGLTSNNDSPASAQALPLNATVGGYLSAGQGFYAGTARQYSYFRDTTDLFSAELIAGDRVSFQIFGSPAEFFFTDAGPPDRMLRILKIQAGALVEVESTSASGDFSTVELLLPETFEAGSYLVEVSASSGIPFRYVLSLADAANAGSLNARYSEPPFMMDQAVVSMAPQAGLQAMTAARGVDKKTPLGDGVWLMQRRSVSAAAMSVHAIPGERKATLDWIQSLNSQPGVEMAEPNYLYFSQMVSPDNDDLYARQWALQLIQAPLAWQAAPGVGGGVGIAVLDTGVFSSTPQSGGNWHPDLSSNIRLIAGETMDFVSGSLDIDGEDNGARDTNPADPGDGKTTSSNFHGTHVAGIAAAVDNDEGVVGVAPSALIYPVRVLGEDGVGSSADLIAAINWAADRSEIDVINLSLGGLGLSSALKDAIDKAWDDGTGKLIVAAAGNQGTDEATYPAAFSNVVGVGAVDGAGVRADYSNLGPSVDLVAPGGDASRDANQDGFADVIFSTWGTDDGDFTPGYTRLQGTSMAAPHVAGVYALMKGQVPDLTPGRFHAFMRGGELTQPVGPEREYGAGLIDALASMDAALGGNIPITLSAAPSALQFNSAVLSGQLALTTFPEGEPVTVNSATSTAGWLTASVETVSASAAGVTVMVNASGLDSTRRYVAELIVSYDPLNGPADTLTIPVSLQLGTVADDRDAGRHYVLLINANDDVSTSQQAVVTAVDGQYRFSFDEVEPGDYFLVAGTDTDYNGLICENGEACAEYPVNGLPETIRVGDAPRSGVSISTSFRRPTLAAMGGPRVGFEGYRVKPETAQPANDDRTKGYAR